MAVLTGYGWDEEGEEYSTYRPDKEKLTVAAGRNFSDWGVRPSSGKTRSVSGGSGYGITPAGSGAASKTPSPIKFNAPTVGTPTFDEPEMGEMPEFMAPEYDEAAIAKGTQRAAASGVRNLRSSVQSALSRRSDNPNVDRMKVRDALAGYGEGLESVMSGASKTATAEYAQKYAYQYKEAGMNYNTAVQAVRDKYQGSMNSRRMEFQAEMNAVNNTFKGELEAERFRVEEARRTESFDYMYDQYKASMFE